MGRLFRKVLAAAVALAALAGLNGCDDSSSNDIGGNIKIRVLSTRADMVSDGDAYVEITLPAGVAASALNVDVDGKDVTQVFALRENGKIQGVLTGLKIGANTVSATLQNSSKGARLTLTNFDRGGPIFSGPHLQPWVCSSKDGKPVTVTVPDTTLSATVTSRTSGLNEDPVDQSCNAAPTYTYYYQPASTVGTGCAMAVTGTNPCFVAYQPASRPADAAIADFKNDRGDTVKSMLRLETGTANRGQYEILSYFDPSKPWAVWSPQKGWNGKVLWKYGAAASGNRFQQRPEDTSFGQTVWDPNALAAGFMVVMAQLTNHFDNPNEFLATETMMMVKEHIIDTYGEVRYVMGDGQSGGAIMQTVISSVMPGLLQGAQTTASYPEGVSFFIEVKDCGLLSNFYQTSAGAAFTGTQRAAIEGKDAAYCKAWVDSFTSAQVPTLAGNCGNGFPASIVYDPVTRPQGVRCSPFDVLVNVFGTSKNSAGSVVPNLPYDNTGVQYGLAALRSGAITAEQFVLLNEQVGSFDADMNWSGGSAGAPAVPALRFRGSDSALPQLYKTGVMANSKNLAKLAIIDLRAERGPDIHQAWRTASMRSRLDAVNGGHGNHVVRGSGANTGAALVSQSFGMMDRWLTAIEADGSSAPLEQKILNGKPVDVHDGCYTSAGDTAAQLATEVSLTDPACPLALTLVDQKSPRIVAGGPLAEDVFQCQLKAFDPASVDYSGAVFSPTQVARLKAVFPQGVCDWSKAGVGYSTQWEPTSLMGGPSGSSLPAAPVAAAFQR